MSTYNIEECLFRIAEALERQVELQEEGMEIARQGMALSESFRDETRTWNNHFGGNNGTSE